MGTPYVGEIRMFAGNFAPEGWMICGGQLLSIAENEVLFTLIGTTYGGDGQTTFALPDMRGRLPVHQGTGSGLSTRVIGQTFGSETVTITSPQLPVHNHVLAASSGLGTASSPVGNVLAQTTVETYAAPGTAIAMSNQAIAPFNGGSQPHDNMQPYLCINFIISLYGIFPSQS